jgi:hypothetical protein
MMTLTGGRLETPGRENLSRLYRKPLQQDSLIGRLVKKLRLPDGA